MDAHAAYRRELGGLGEEMAAVFLERSGIRVVDRNWRSPAGEIDIVARDGPVLVVAEVKTRTRLGYGHPVEAIGRRKRQRLRSLGRAWARARRVRCHPLRIDGLGVLITDGRVFISHERGMA
ncbi:YraN family protein [Nocardiopsis sp. N85]|uniref:YraN family protein n=1 Tax=Nocardiopsis sp. N85 TaxID=3029400 RepID=UPI00237F4927|nr:YraN family protein [Nocardiopsis sp. N85]MDE3721597.1 YraN family protein [Nocardiopsis sp. N85]